MVGIDRESSRTRSDLYGATLPGSSPASREVPSDLPAPGYQLGTIIGLGGMGEVIAARDQRIGRDVAIKRMRAANPDAGAIARFLREARIQARLDHPAIVPVYEMGHDVGGRPYFTMKRLAGRTLASVFDQRTATLQRLLRAFADVCLAVEFAHARGIVHRDLKPSNIMLGDYGEVYVLDWGVARVLVDRERETPADLPSLDGDATVAGAPLGTPGYMAPEQVRGDDVRTAADVYALGSILFEMLVGESLHPRGNHALATTLERIDTSPARRCPARALPPELDAACIAALVDDPASRPTARALGERIQRYLDGDRDLERRRALASEQLAAAHAALASGDPGRRAEAVHASGRALALDPSSSEAADLVTQLIVEPPPELPPELAGAVDAEEQKLARARSRRALAAFAGFALIPLFGLLDLHDPTPMVGLYAALAGMMTLSWINWRVARVPVAVMLGGQLLLAVMSSRINGPFVVTPILMVGQLVSITNYPWVNTRKWATVAWTALAVLLPFALERLGVFASTWSFSGGGLVSRGEIIQPLGGFDAPIAIAIDLCAITAVALFALAVAGDRRDAQRKLQIQAWHLRQLLPRGGA